MNNYQIIPENEPFSPSLEAAGCFLEFEDKILCIKRSPHISQGGLWCIPGGKLEKNEAPLSGVLREVFEEVGIALNENEMMCIGKLQIRRPTIDYTFHIYRVLLQEMPVVQLCADECTEAEWLDIEEVKKLPLIMCGEDVLAHYAAYIKNTLQK